MEPSTYLLVFQFFIISAVLPVSTNDMFLVSAPNVFHVGVKEAVSVQLHSSMVNVPVSIYLEHEVTGMLVSEKPTVQLTGNQEKMTAIVMLAVERDKISSLPSSSTKIPYLLLVCEIRGQRRMTRVLLSQHRGYIFIQTDQPVYNPTQIVKYRIFTLDHSMKPHGEIIYISITTAEGNRILSRMVNAHDGIFSSNIQIPDVSEEGVWKIVAHYQGDEKNAATQEFQVKKFVMPTFDVSIKPQDSYFLVNREKFEFTILARYSYGETIKGAFHCRFGVREEGEGDTEDRRGEITFIRGLEETGLIKDGMAVVTVETSRLNDLLRERNSSELAHLVLNGAHLYIAVSVTDIASGELQEAEVSLPIVSRRFSVDFSRTRSFFTPGMPFQVSVVVRLPNGSPAPHIPVEIQLPVSIEKQVQGTTNSEGAVNTVFNVPRGASALTVGVTVDDHQYETTALPVSSPSGNFLHMSVESRVMSPGEQITVDFNVVNGSPFDGRIYYLVLSRGTIRKSDSVMSAVQSGITISISSDLTPSFRIISYYYNQNRDIVADSVWVDVKDVCAGKILLTSPSEKDPRPGSKATFKVDLEGQKAKVALLLVDKAIYALNADNKLTPKQVFASMQSYDLGCSYGGGYNSFGVFSDAGLSFISQSTQSEQRKGFSCESGFRRPKRSINLQQLMTSKVSIYTDPEHQRCCRDGFTLIPMRLTCEERSKRASRNGQKPHCVKALLDCCLEGMKLRAMKRLEEERNGPGRTADEREMEDFFDTSIGNIRRFFPPSLEFVVIEVDERAQHSFVLPDSITTWEVQAASVSTTHGFCVAEPLELRAFKGVFVSLRLPYSVRRYEQLSIIAVVYNYEDTPRQLTIHMKPVEGLCSPGSASRLSYLNVSVPASSSQTVTFSAVPMTTGHIPITLLVYDTEAEMGLDAIEKLLLVKTEGVVKRDETTHVIDLDGRMRQHLLIDAAIPSDRIPDSTMNLFARVEGEVFGTSTALPLLSPSGLKGLLQSPTGCAEQTMIRMSPTALALRYLDHSEGWDELPPGTKDLALSHIENGYSRILTFKKNNNSYGAWKDFPSSNWLTALVVKVMSLVAEQQRKVREELGRERIQVSEEEIQKSVKYLISQQNADGSFSDPKPIIHREMQGGVGGVEGDVSLTAFIAISLNHSLPFLDEDERKNTEASIALSTAYLFKGFQSLERPYAIAITAYCLSTCQSNLSVTDVVWKRLKELATEEGDCRVWRSKDDMRQPSELRHYKAPPPEAITVETTGYALLTALANKDLEWADSAACWLSEQENYGGGFRSTQDTIVALEALSRLALSRPTPPATQVDIQFSVPGRSQVEKLSLEKKGGRAEVELKRLLGDKINANLKGTGKAKLKMVKAYHVLQPEDSCQLLSIKVTVQGKVSYTAQVMESYNYEDYYGKEGGEEERKEEEEERDRPWSEIDWFDARSRRRRDTAESLSSQKAVEYEVCVSHHLSRNLSGMSIADITLLSGFEVQKEDLEKLKSVSDRYISHYEIENGRVLLYFDEISEGSLCIKFGAVQMVPIGLVQPAPATFYDYYEPDRRCTRFYAAPQKSKMVTTLCSADVCQCAEKPCHTEKKTFDKRIKKTDRLDFACYYPTVDYSYKVQVDSMSERSNFALYSTTVTDVLRATSDISVKAGSTRVFAKRRHCKDKLETGKSYLIMGKDGLTTDTQNQMQYLLDSKSWVELLPSESQCRIFENKSRCSALETFMSSYQTDGCKQ